MADYRQSRMLATALYLLGLVCLSAAGVLELRRGDDPRIAYLQGRLQAERDKSVSAQIRADASTAIIERLKGLLREASHRTIQPPAAP